MLACSLALEGGEQTFEREMENETDPQERSDLLALQ